MPVTNQESKTTEKSQSEIFREENKYKYTGELAPRINMANREEKSLGEEKSR